MNFRVGIPSAVLYYSVEYQMWSSDAQQIKSKKDSLVKFKNEYIKIIEKYVDLQKLPQVIFVYYWMNEWIN